MKRIVILLLIITGTSAMASGPSFPFHTIHYRLDINIYHCFADPYPNSYNASILCTLSADSVIHQVNLNADLSSLVIDSVSLNGASFTRLNNILTISLDRTYNPGENFEVKIFYHHLDVHDGAFTAGDGMVFTNCEPEGARKWFPCHDVPSDKATFEITARTPPGITLASIGILADSSLVNDTLSYHWVSPDPVATYLIAIAASVNYNVSTLYWRKPSNPSDSIPAKFYYLPGQDPSPVENVIKQLADFYSASFCEYPFQKIGFAGMNLLFYGGGMENQTLITLCATCWRESLAAHEFAHMWFGDLITCATWADIWLNEGFATWITVHWQEHNQGYESYKSFLISQYARPYLANNPGYAISDSAWMTRTPSFDTLFNTYITYEKGACMVHQLRYLLGDSLFFGVLKAYTNDSSLRFRFATIGDMMNVVNAVAGVNYDWFFNDWIFRPNHPVYQNSYDILKNADSSYTVRFLAHQTQRDPSFFRMILPLRIVFADGTDTMMRVMNSANNQLFSFGFPKQPARLVFDPDTNIMLKEGSTLPGFLSPGSKPAPFELYQCYPDPANGQATIPYSLGIPLHVRLEIFDIGGRLVSVPFEQDMTVGKYNYKLDCSYLKPGIYFYRMTAGQFNSVRKLMIR